MMINSNEEEIFQDLCFSNGIDPINDIDKETSTFPQIDHLEMFFIGFPRIASLNKFPNLKTLMIFGQELKKISGLDTCVNLTELWICECQIERISGLNNCRNLKRLYLYSNKIIKIENLSELNLEVLWLNNNKIETIEGLDHMNELKKLNLANNRIKLIGDSLKNLRNLEYLNLAANNITSFEDVLNLQCLFNLKHLSFKDPQYGQCPITMLCNYAIFMIYHFNELQYLDTLPVIQKSLKELADATINKKKLWYNMKLNTLFRETQELKENLNTVKKTQFDAFLKERTMIFCKLKDIEKYRTNKIENSDQTINEEKMQKDINTFQNRIEEINKKISTYEQEYKTTIARIDEEKEFERKLIFIELENGGNIKFEHGKQEDIWFKSCHDLLLSRFCSSDYILRAISGIKIHKIIKMTNRSLLAKFEENLFSYVDENEYLVNKASLRKQMDYLFYCWRPQINSQIDELYEIVKYGFKEPFIYKQAQLETAVPFSNSLSVSDHFRMEFLAKNKGPKTNDTTCQYKHGFALLCKVYTNNFTKYDKSDICENNYKEKLGVLRHFCISQNLRKSNPMSVTKEFLETQRTCDCKAKQAEYFLFNKYLAVPEYIIEFEYLTKYQSENNFSVDMKTNNQTNDSIEINSEFIDNNSNNILEQIKNNPSITENFINLNLHNCQLSHLNTTFFRNFRLLKKLILSFNNLTSLKEVCHIYSLEYLDVSHNKIESLHDFKGISKLVYLDLSSNLLSDLIDTITTTKKYFPNLKNFNIDENPFEKTDGIKYICLHHIKTLDYLNNENITNHERDIASKKLTQELTVENSLYLVNRPRSIKYSFVTDYCKKHENRNNRTNDQTGIPYLNISDSNWQLKVTVLCLDSQHIIKLTYLGTLLNLRWASFDNNYINKIEGLESCTKLEELTMQNNYLKSLDGLEHMKNLRKLDVSHNQIVFDNSDFESIRINSPRLSYLSISNNKIKSLKFVQKLPSLLELYASYNKIHNIREIFHLKQMVSLVIVDLWCNPMCSDSRYRLFVIYHLKNLKSLDGYTIESSESSEAKDQFGGKLTCDFIAEKFSQIAFNELRSLDLPHCSIRHVDLGQPQIAAQQFENLRSLNLENNCLTSFSGLIYLRNLKTLCLNYNKIESIFPRNKSNSLNYTLKLSNDQRQLYDVQPIMENLEVLHLGYNSISDMAALQLGKLISLKVLFLQGNEITKVEGIENLRNLRELILDKNKIKFISETSFIGQSRLIELHMEENRLKDFSNMSVLRHLEKLYMASNKISELVDIEKLTEFTHLQELSLINNPISKKPHYRITIIDRMPRLRILDMMEVTDEDRAKAQFYFSEQYQQLQQVQPQILFNTISGYAQTSAQIPTSMNALLNQYDSQLLNQNMNSPRLKPILFMDKLVTNNTSTTNSNSKSNKNKQNKFKNQY